jgi:CheY-like chemotaxis protein
MSRPKLLLVENDPYFIYLLKLYAEQSGFSVVNTSSGSGVFALAQQEQPAVIVLESELPEVTGWEILTHLRSEPCTRQIPVVMCLWHDSQHRADMTPFEALLHKPMQFDDFILALRDIGVLPEGGPDGDGITSRADRSPGV